MVNFRFHLVSLVAVFLALALGIGMGVTVIDRALVEQLQVRLDDVRSQVDSANQRSDLLASQIDNASEFEQIARQYLLPGALESTSVTLLAMRGVDEAHIDELGDDLEVAGAFVTGTIWINAEAELSSPDQLDEVAEVLGVPGAGVERTRQALLTRLAAVLAGASPASDLAPLVEAGAVEWDGLQVGEVSNVQFADTRFVLASDFEAEAANELVAIPLVSLLAAQPDRRLVAVEPGTDPGPDSSGERGLFVGPLRSNGGLNDRLSTVDHLEAEVGRLATVLALAQLPDEVGDYGLGPDADEVLPPPTS